jgi:HAD superfamily hydrolase (TIGR01509 family)
LLTAGFDLVIFDCDGVLVDSEVLSCQCLSALLGRYGLAITPDQAMQKFLGRSASAVSDYYFLNTGRDLPPRFHGELLDLLTQAFREKLSVLPHLQTLLAGFGGRYCVASSSSPERLSMTLSTAGLDQLFAGSTYNAGMVKHGKPAPDLFLLAAKEMHADPLRTLVIEDSVNGVLAGKAAGMTVWGFTGGSHHRNRDGATLLTEAGADRIIQSFAELLSPEKIVG